jgi:hypothetical protein
MFTAGLFVYDRVLQTVLQTTPTRTMQLSPTMYATRANHRRLALASLHKAARESGVR